MHAAQEPPCTFGPAGLIMLRRCDCSDGQLAGNWGSNVFLKLWALSAFGSIQLKLIELVFKKWFWGLLMKCALVEN